VLLAWRDAPTSFSAAASRLAIGRLRGDEKQRVQRGTEAVVSASGCCGPAVGVRVGGGGGRVAGGSGRPARGGEKAGAGGRRRAGRGGRAPLARPRWGGEAGRAPGAALG